MAPRCCSFGAVRCWLVLLNIFYIMVALFLIGLVIAARTLAYDYTNVPILIGVAVVASFLFLVAVLGLFGACKHHQVILFFYMIVLGLTGFVLFAVSAATLAAPKKFVSGFFRTVWEKMDTKERVLIQSNLDCCGFEDLETPDTQLFGIYMYVSDDSTELPCRGKRPFCNDTEDEYQKKIKCCSASSNNSIVFPPNITESQCHVYVYQICPDCNHCYTAWEKTVQSGIYVVGSFGLIFSFTQIIGIVVALRYRNLKDPDANPSAFL